MLIPSIVFAHGLWADGSCFSKLIPTLLAEGYEVMASQHGLDSLTTDVTAVRACLGRVHSPAIPHLEGRENRRPPNCASCEVRACPKPEDRQSARSLHASDATRHGRRGDRVRQSGSTGTGPAIAQTARFRLRTFGKDFSANCGVLQKYSAYE